MFTSAPRHPSHPDGLGLSRALLALQLGAGYRLFSRLYATTSAVKLRWNQTRIGHSLIVAVVSSSEEIEGPFDPRPPRRGPQVDEQLQANSA